MHSVCNLSSGAYCSHTVYSYLRYFYGGRQWIMVDYGQGAVEEWWNTVHLSKVEGNLARVLRKFGQWLMRHHTNTHNFTLFTTFLHYMRSCTLRSGAYTHSGGQ
jgi:hypothetical protein